MRQQQVEKNYISDVDQFLKKFDKDHPKLSMSQQKEKDKYDRIYLLRDNKEQVIEVQTPLWKGFFDDKNR